MKTKLILEKFLVDKDLTLRDLQKIHEFTGKSIVIKNGGKKIIIQDG